MTRGNQEANKTANQAAWETLLIGVLIAFLDLSEFKPHYTEWGKEWAHE